MRIELVPTSDGARRHSVTLWDNGQVVLGRGEEVDIQLMDEGLSRVHCLMERNGDEVTIRDARSRNGTWVNGERVEAERLETGDRLRFGKTEFELRIDNASGVSHTERTPDGGIRREFKKRLHIDDSDLMQPAEGPVSIEQLKRVQRDLAAVYEIGNLINAETSPDELHDRVLGEIFDVLYPDRGFLLLVPKKDGEMEVASQRPLKLGKHQSLSRTIANECYRQRVSIMRVDALNDQDYGKAESVLQQKIHSVMCAPVESLSRAYGVLYIDRLTNPKPFSRRDLDLLAAVAKQAGIAIERTRLLGQVRRMMYSTVQALVASIEAKDEDTKGHSIRVKNYALALARQLEAQDDELEALKMASLLHDVGKIGVEVEVLRKPAALTAEEYALVQNHPAVGSEIVANVETAGLVAEIILQHHERWDGTGYPDGLAGEQINHMARILSVADSMDAMLSARPYRPALEVEALLRELKNGTGTQFDPQVAEVAISCIERGELIPKPHRTLSA